LAVAITLSACGSSLSESSSMQSVVYDGARLIVGNGTDPIEDAVFVVESGRIAAVGTRATLPVSTDGIHVDLRGKTVMPALVGLHGHLGFQEGLSYAADNYTRANIINQLRQYAYYGVGTIVSLGTDDGDLAFDIRAEQETKLAGTARLRTAGRGLAAPNAGPGSEALRGSADGVTNEEEARRYVSVLAMRDVDVVKIWVDDRGGSVEKLASVYYRAIIDEAHAHGLRVIAHVFSHADAVDLVNVGVDGFAHLVRDQEMDDALVAAIVERGVFVMPNLGVSERRTYNEVPHWLDDPLLAETVPAEVRQRAAESYREYSEADVKRRRRSYAGMQRSLAKLLAAGAKIVLGADSGVRDHFFGYAEHRELELMVAAGMTPAQAIEAATGRAAEVLGFDDVGTFEIGKSADFLVLDANPLVDIVNTRLLSAVYLRGDRVDRDLLRAEWNKD
jgi:imidazolonepropionase-like amidohydrolase